MEDLRLDTKKEFIQRTISPLLEDEELLQTLRVLFERNFSIKKTAEALHIHINTLHYRIKKIEDHTSLNPKKTKDQFTLYLGLYILDHYTK
nr:helix-turn-helix domain-containing protein [Heyndrickxia oleronia]